MTTIAETTPGTAPLSRWLQLLWGLTPPLRASGASPYIAAGAIHLPAHHQWRHQAAAAAHAAAHLVYSPTVFDGTGLGAIARALVALLEDARVEALATRELPGLARLWRPWHDATPASGTDFEALMQRLARALADPDYDDPHPWVRKGRALFFIDAALGLLALRTPAEVRRAATLLGHDIGQMRLRFDAARYCPQPAYRDDHRWMWSADMPEAVAPPPRRADEGAQRAAPDDAADSPLDDPRDEASDDLPEDGEAAADDAGVATWHPEWDRLIARLRPAWCQVLEHAVPTPALPMPPWPRPAIAPGSAYGMPYPGSTASMAAHETLTGAELQRTSVALRGPARALARHTRARRRVEDGDWLDPDAAVAWRVDLRTRRSADARVWRVNELQPASAAVFLLIDQSVSTAAARTPGGPSLLRTAALSAAALALALRRARIPCAIAAFASRGRLAVRLNQVQSFDTPLDTASFARLAALRPGGSTRLGAALRHATSRLAQRRAARRWIIVLSDGEPHDVDVHDPRYLADDARHAVLDASRRGVRTACLVLDAQHLRLARRIFGPAGAGLLDDLAGTPSAMRRLVG